VGEIKVEENIYTLDKKSIIRPFQLNSGITNRCYSRRAQLLITDLASDTSFNKVSAKLKLHHGIYAPDTAIRKITLSHASKIKENHLKMLGKEKGKEIKKLIISETDGSMIGIVDIDDSSKDKRKGKKVRWQEIKLSMAYEAGSLNAIFSGTLKDAADAGKHIYHCINKLGFDKNTYIHHVSDGAVWISDQVDLYFGSQAKYLVDFYHVSEYLAGASLICASDNSKTWMQEQQHLLKANQVVQVLSNLQPYREIKLDNKYPAENCYRYLNNRRHQLDYKTAIDKDLPIGSGDIESAHRYVIQDRLKKAGAWWKEENVESMLHLRLAIANSELGDYWNSIRKS
jgi:hypothetical protein